MMDVAKLVKVANEATEKMFAARVAFAAAAEEAQKNRLSSDRYVAAAQLGVAWDKTVAEAAAAWDSVDVARGYWVPRDRVVIVG